jgi:hypothetical protein
MKKFFRPEAEALFQQRVAAYSLESPHARCLPEGPAQIFGTAVRIIRCTGSYSRPRSSGCCTKAGVSAKFFMDGRQLPKDPNPTRYGYSVAHWDGDALVVETWSTSATKTNGTISITWAPVRQKSSSVLRF